MIIISKESLNSLNDKDKKQFLKLADKMSERITGERYNNVFDIIDFSYNAFKTKSELIILKDITPLRIVARRLLSIELDKKELNDLKNEISELNIIKNSIKHLKGILNE